MDRAWGPWLIGAGVLLAAIGLLAWTGALSWLGRLPGDLRYERDGVSIYAPFTTMLLISVLGSFVLWAVGKVGGG